MKIQATARLRSLTEKQKQLDINGDGKISSDDLRRLRDGEKPEKVESAQTVNVKFKDGSTHKVKFFNDPNKGKGGFSLRTDGMPTIIIRKMGGDKYVAYTGESFHKLDEKSAFQTKTGDAKEAYLKAIKHFWNAV